VKPDDPSVGNDEVLYRYSPSIPHKNWTVVDQETKEIQIALAALSWDEDGISCYRELILREHGLTWVDIKREPKNGVFSLVVQDIRRESLGVAFDPYPENSDGHLRDAAHTLIVDCGLPKKVNKAARERLAVGAKIIHHGDDDESMP
jgi:hypothetical protein